MIRPERLFERILVPLDDSSCAQRAFIHALSFGHAFRSEVHLLHVIEHPEAESVQEAEREMRSAFAEVELAAKRYLAVLARDAAAEVSVHQHTRSASDAASAILRSAERLATDLIVIGAQGARAWRREMGGTAAKIVRGATCPVLTVGPSGGRAPEFVQRILVPTDFSPAARCALQVAEAMAYWLDAELLLLHVVPPTTHPLVRRDRPPQSATRWAETLSKVEDSLRACAREEQLAVRCRMLTEQARPADGILALARRYDAHLIVQGSCGRAGSAGDLGSVATEVVRRAQCSVVTVKGEPLSQPATAPAQETAEAGADLS